MRSVSVTEVKNHIPDLVVRSHHAKERFVITQRGKPVAALVSLEDLQLLEQLEARQELHDIAAKWKTGFNGKVGLGF